MNRIKVGVVFGGMSTEHLVSIVSGNSVINNLNQEKYEISSIYISKEGIWYIYNGRDKKYQVGDQVSDIKKIGDVFEYLKTLDVVFPVLHGLYGEDGTIQGMFELLKVPYVGCKVLASSVGMDKVYTKIIFEKAGIKQAKYEYIRKNNNKYIYVAKDFTEKEYELKAICELISNKIKYPIFVKPSNSGSSVGINKAYNIQDLERHISHASKFDNKILLEETLIGREIECSVLGNEEVKASCVGEIKPADEFYSFDAKYNNADSKLTIPAEISEELANRVRELAIKAFKSIDGEGFARVDFFVNEEANEIYINEINTIPGFTEISMYPKLWEASGVKYPDLLEKLIKLAME